ncbi:unnamed protein product, partial [Urochloa humidicola]
SRAALTASPVARLALRLPLTADACRLAGSHSSASALDRASPQRRRRPTPAGPQPPPRQPPTEQRLGAGPAVPEPRKPRYLRRSARSPPHLCLGRSCDANAYGGGAAAAESADAAEGA